MTILERHVLITPSASLQNVQFIFTPCLGDSQERPEFVLKGEVEEGYMGNGCLAGNTGDHRVHSELICARLKCMKRMRSIEGG